MNWLRKIFGKKPDPDAGWVPIQMPEPIGRAELTYAVGFAAAGLTPPQAQKAWDWIKEQPMPMNTAAAAHLFREAAQEGLRG